MYYNYNNLFSRNAMFNFIIGERGVGKTYGILKKVVKDFIKTKDVPIKRDPATNEILEGPSQFVYLRRYKTELKNFKTIFEPLVINGEFGDHEITVKGDKVYVDNQLAGYGFAASNAVILKSSTFPLVDTIIFDEFIIDKGNLHYLQNEVDKFLEVYETIARMRDVKVYFLGNAITIANPYFEYWDLNIPFNSEFRTYRDGLILVNYIKNDLLQYKNLGKYNENLYKALMNAPYLNYNNYEILPDVDKVYKGKNIYCLWLTGDFKKDNELINLVEKTNDLIFYFYDKNNKKPEILDSGFEYWLNKSINTPVEDVNINIEFDLSNIVNQGQTYILGDMPKDITDIICKANSFIKIEKDNYEDLTI